MAKKEKYESMRIMSLEGSVLYKNEGFTATKDSKPDPQAFRGILDESLDTLKLAEVYDQHKSEIGYPYLDGKKRFCRAVVNLSFNRAVKVYESYGNRNVLNGYRVTDEDMQDHVCVRIVNGRPTLIAIDVSYRENSGYAPVEEPLPDAMLGKYFKYDPDTRSYKQSDKVIPTAFTCQDIREHLYTHGFDIDGIHYVRYKRSAGASRDGRCLFIAEPLYADMMAWSSCDLSADTASDQASWQAYIALTLSSIENVIKLPKKAILIIRDRVSRFKADAVCVKETDAHDLRAEEEETEIENVIWDGEALLDASVFFENGYNDHGMMLLRNRFFKTCAFNTNLQDWFGNGAHVAGEMVSTYDLQKTFDTDNTLISIFTIIAIFLIVMLVFRSLSLPVILVEVIQGAIWISMSTSLLTGPMFFMSYIITNCILMGATIDYGILMSTNYVQYRQTLDKKEALARSVEIAIPTVFTSGLILTICGFVVGIISSQTSISTVGFLLGKGTLVSVLMITLVLPSVLYLLDGFILKLSMKKKQ